MNALNALNVLAKPTRLLVFATALATAFSLLNVTQAQQRGELVEGLLRSYLENQLNQSRQQTLQNQRQSDRYRTRPGDAQSNQRMTADLAQYQRQLGLFAQQSNALVGLLDRNVNRIQGLRPLMPDAHAVRTRAQLMYDKSRQVNQMSVLRTEYRDLDSQWRELSFKLQQLRGLDATSQAYIRQLDSYCDGVCRLMDLAPQFDREAVFRLAIETAAHLDNLVDDIQYDLAGTPKNAARLRECRGLAEQCRRLSRLANRASYDELITEYTTFVNDWRQFAGGMYTLDSPASQRTLRRVHQANQQAFDHLWTPLSLDRDYLKHVSYRMTTEVDDMFENMTVKTLVQLDPNQQQAVLQTARDLYTQCHRYAECVNGNKPLSNVTSDYVTLAGHWRELNGYMRPITNGTTAVQRRRIDSYNTEIQTLLRVPVQMDRGAVTKLAASLEEMSHHLLYDVRRYGRYYRSAQFQSKAFQQADSFYNTAQSLHAEVQRGAALNQLQNRCNSAIHAWNALSETITAMPGNGLSATRFQHIDTARQQIRPVIVDLASRLN